MNAEDFRNGPVVVTAFDWVPHFAQGFVRDLRLRWALEEAGFDYEIEILPQGAQTEPEHLARQPFGQIPTMAVGDRTMFESGACVWRIAEASEALLPRDPAARDACFSWLFGAIDTVEEPINLLATLRFFATDSEAARRIEPQACEMLADRLRRFQAALGERDHLVADRFTVADLMMTFVLRNAEPAGDLEPFPAIKAYVARHAARPAFRRALEGQLTPFRQNAAKYQAAS